MAKEPETFSWLEQDVYFGSFDAPLPDWRKHMRPEDSEDDAEPTEEDLRGVRFMLGFDPRELDEG